MLKRTVGRLARHPNAAPMALLCLIIVLGAALRLYDLGAESYWFDEVAMVRMLQRTIPDIMSGPWLARPPAYVIPAHLWVGIFGTSEAATRSLSALFGVASIGVVYAVGSELFGKEVGLVSALLMAISEFQIYYSQETRFYALFGFSTLLSFLLYIRALRRPSTRAFVAYVAASLLLVYSHFYAVFVVAAQVLYFLLLWIRHKRLGVRWFLSEALVSLALLPYLVPFVLGAKTVAGDTAMGWIPDRPLWYPLRTLYSYVFPLRHERTWVAVGISLAAGMIFFTLGLALFVARKGVKRWLASAKGLLTEAKGLSTRTDELLLTGLWLLCPIALPFVLSRVLGPMYVDRYTISAAPALYLLLAVGIVTVRKAVPASVVLGALGLVIAPGLQHYYVTDVKEQWREVAAYVEENAGKGDVIVFAPDDSGLEIECFNWYYQGNLPECGIDVLLYARDDAAIADALSSCTSGSDRFWLIMRGSPDVVERFARFFLGSGLHDARQIDGQQFTSVSVYLFEMARQ